MDPNQAWTDLCAAVADDDWDTASEIADNLLDWLTKGGFPPHISGVYPFDRLVAKAACEAVTSWEVV